MNISIARILAETIWTILSQGIPFDDEIDHLTERKMSAMRIRSLRPNPDLKVSDAIKLIKKRIVMGSVGSFFSSKTL